MTLFEEALQQFEEATIAFTTANRNDPSSNHECLVRMARKRDALVKYVEALSEQTQALRTQLEERIRRQS